MTFSPYHIMSSQPHSPHHLTDALLSRGSSHLLLTQVFLGDTAIVHLNILISIRCTFLCLNGFAPPYTFNGLNAALPSGMYEAQSVAG